ncbi:unnamed product [Ostreococcus tauri]|uniref:Unnamed product n=1 Tax=Ostreococcus tauri TaxID=70448 RepID=A0A096P8T6_OSTTA|nr:unnamed product [Ostreococcus tauri]CEG00446.1 unnamed product [Ostreococcus tauri]|eukprot:XP_022840384.1 unnamed product [Ostreococcus tauri]
MGFLTRVIASGIEDGARREAALERHLERVTTRCEALRDNWDQPTKSDKFWLKAKARLAHEDAERAGEHPGRRAPW